MSKELKWWNNFRHAVILKSHKRKRVRKKNIKRVEKLSNQALIKWGCYPYPQEWILYKNLK